MSGEIWGISVDDVRLPVVLVVMDARSGEILDVRVEQPQYVTAMLALQGRKNGKNREKSQEKGGE